MKKCYYGFKIMAEDFIDEYFPTSNTTNSTDGTFNLTSTLLRNGTNSSDNSSSDYSSSVYDYVETYSQLMTNIMFHLGDIYDNLQGLYYFVYRSPYSPGYTCYEAGYLLGDTVYLAHLPPGPLEKIDIYSQITRVMAVLSRQVLGLALA
mmetsp:Transcript_49158/g.36211  ORF Transcript_49158/g.36211 Transcript_49158/m.36211 type:complete len:149 (-) Transcript_49158:57-503(-)